MTSSQYDPYIWGHTHPTMGGYNGLPSRKAELIPVKTSLSSDWGLQLAPMKMDLVVIADQQAAVNTFSLFVHTAHQASKVGGA